MATLDLNGCESEIKYLPSPGLPQGLPLSLILFLFYNANLVKKRIINREGAVAFIDNYTAWVVGDTAGANLTGIREIINHSLAWEL